MHCSVLPLLLLALSLGIGAHQRQNISVDQDGMPASSPVPKIKDLSSTIQGITGLQLKVPFFSVNMENDCPTYSISLKRVPTYYYRSTRSYKIPGYIEYVATPGTHGTINNNNID